MPFHRAQRFPQVVRVGAVHGRVEYQSKLLPVRLEEVSKLLGTSTSVGGFEVTRSYSRISASSAARAGVSFGARSRLGCSAALGSARWGEDAYVDSVSKRLKRTQHSWFDLTPVQSAIAVLRGGMAMDAMPKFGITRVSLEAGLDVGELGSGAPMLFCGEVDYVPRTSQRPGLPYVHAAKHDLTPLAGRLVVLEHRGPCFLNPAG